MRHGNVGFWALALTLGLAATAAADDPPSSGGSRGLISRFFNKPKTTPQAERDLKPDELVLAPAVPTPEAAQRQARADLLRRQEICLKLREIALETRDPELDRKAEQLEQRAFDAYVQQIGKAPAQGVTAEATLQRHLAPEPTQGRGRLLQASGSARSSTAQTRTATREDEP